MDSPPRDAPAWRPRQRPLRPAALLCAGRPDALFERLGALSPSELAQLRAWRSAPTDELLIVGPEALLPTQLNVAISLGFVEGYAGLLMPCFLEPSQWPQGISPMLAGALGRLIVISPDPAQQHRRLILEAGAAPLNPTALEELRRDA